MEKKTSNTPKRRILTSAKSEKSSYFKAFIARRIAKLISKMDSDANTDTQVSIVVAAKFKGDEAIIMEVKGNEIPELIEIINKSILTTNTQKL